MRAFCYARLLVLCAWMMCDAQQSVQRTWVKITWGSWLFVADDPDCVNIAAGER